jgi:hypothetical protein
MLWAGTARVINQILIFTPGATPFLSANARLRSANAPLMMPNERRI